MESKEADKVVIEDKLDALEKNPGTTTIDEESGAKEK